MFNYIFIIGAYILHASFVFGDTNPASEKVTELKELIAIDGGLLKPILLFFTVMFSAYLFLKLTTSLLEKIAENRPYIRHHVKRYIPVLNVLTWIVILLLAIKSILNPSYQTLLAFGASAGIAIGLSLQDILKNIFGGFLLLIESPFSVGDKIRIGEHYGEVVFIGLRSVRLQTPGDSIVTVPNSEFIYKAVSNANSGNPYCQVATQYYLPINTNIENVKHIMVESAKISKYCNVNLPITVVMENISQNGTSLLKFTLKAYVLDIREEFQFISDMTERVLKEV